MAGAGLRPTWSEKIDYYTSRMHRHYGPVLRGMGRRFCDPIRVDPGQVARVQELRERGTVVYVARTRSTLDYLCCNAIFLREKLPLAWFANGINLTLWQPLPTVFRTQVVKFRHYLRGRRFPDPARSGYLEFLCRTGRASLVFLTSGTSLWERLAGKPLWDPIQALVEAQLRIDRPIYLVPQILFLERRPGHMGRSWVDVLFGPTLDPGRIRRLLTLFRGHRTASLHLAEPIDLAAFLADHADEAPERLGRLVRLTLRSYLYREYRVTTGPAKKPRSKTRERVMAHLKEDISAIALRDGKSEAEVSERAQSMIDEIASDASVRMLEFLSAFFAWVWNNLFRRVHVDPSDMNRVRAHLKQAPLVLIASHKSHLDYLMISWLFYNHDITPPHIAAGINLNFWPVGTIFRKAGAFYIRRSFGGSKLYPVVFRRYLRYMMRSGYSIEFFIEGGRSRSGKLKSPKYGLLQMIVDTFLEGGLEDLFLVPISVNYDNVPEDRAHAREMKGLPKDPESLAQLLGLTRILTKRYGRVYVRVGQIQSLREYVNRHDLSSIERSTPEWRDRIDDLAHRISRAINDVMTVTSTSLVSAILLAAEGSALTRSEIDEGMGRLLDALRFLGAPLSPILSDREPAILEALRLLARFGLVRVERTGPAATADDAAYRTAEDEALRLGYYRNTILHFLRGLFELSHALLHLGGGQHLRPVVYQAFERLDRLFDGEFLGVPGDSPRHRFEPALRYLESIGALESRPGGRVQFPRDRREILSFYAQMAGDLFEAYDFTLRTLYPPDRPPLTTRQPVGSLLAASKKAIERGRLQRPETVCKPLFETAHQSIHALSADDRAGLAGLLRPLRYR